MGDDMNHQLNTPTDVAAPLGVQSFQPQPSGMMNVFDPMARAAAVAPMYSMTYLDGIQGLAKAAVSSRLYGELNEGQATMILQTGLEMGIHPTVALRNIGSFKGKTTISSQLMLALAKAAGYMEEILENSAEAATVQISKPGRNPYKIRFTIEDAKKAGLLDRNALYKSMPAVMLLNRAIGFAVRYGAPEVGAGLYTPEEAMDIQDDPGRQFPKGTLSEAQGQAWTVEEEECFAELLDDDLYTWAKGAKRPEIHTEQSEKWRKRKSAGESAGTLIEELEAFIEKLKGAAQSAPSAGLKPSDKKDAEPQLPEGWTPEQAQKFRQVLTEIEAAFETLGFGDKFPGYELKQIGYQKANTNAAPLITKLESELEKLQERVKKQKQKPTPEPETLPADDLPVMDGEIVGGPGDAGFALQPGAENVDAAQGIPADELNAVMGLYWTRIQELMVGKGDKATKIATTKTKLLNGWTVGIRPDDTENYERAVVRGQIAWIEANA